MNPLSQPTTTSCGFVRRTKRWAVATDAFFLGKYYWHDADEDEISPRTFRTRQQAREAAKKTGIKARIVKVIVTITRDETP